MKCRLRLSRRGMILIILILFIVLINRLLHWSGTLATLSGTVPRQLLPLLLMAAALGADAMSLCVGIGLRGVAGGRCSGEPGHGFFGDALAGALGGHFRHVGGGIARVLGAGLVALIGVRMIRSAWGQRESLQSVDPGRLSPPGLGYRGQHRCPLGRFWIGRLWL